MTKQDKCPKCGARAKITQLDASGSYYTQFYCYSTYDYDTKELQQSVDCELAVMTAKRDQLQERVDELENKYTNANNLLKSLHQGIKIDREATIKNMLMHADEIFSHCEGR